MAKSTQGNVTATAGGPGLATLLAVAFIVLKLTGVITWSWIWVLAPIWIPFAIFIVVLIGMAIFVAVKK